MGKILKFFDADPGSGMETIRIRDKNHGSATLLNSLTKRFLIYQTVFRSLTLYANTSVVICIGFNADPDSNTANVNPDPNPGSQTNSDPC